MIYKILSKYHTLSVIDKHHRFKSWEHCNNFFIKHKGNLEDESLFDYSCLMLAFYLASWGMMRGSTFLLQKDYRIHEYFIKNIAMNDKYNKYYSLLKETTINIEDINGIDELIKDTRKVYVDNIKDINGEKTMVSVTDTLTSKILLGVYGIVPAYDSYFVNVIKMYGFKNTSLCEESLKELVNFYYDFQSEFEACRVLFEKDGVQYPPMKLIDMYFWQIGYMLDNANNYKEEELQRIRKFANRYKIKNRQVIQPNKKEKCINHINRKEKFIGLKEEITNYILNLLEKAEENGMLEFEISSGEIHKAMKLKDRIPSVCNAMVKINEYKYEIIKDTASGKSSTKVVRYYLN